VTKSKMNANQQRWEVLGLGAPMIDQVLRVSDDFLSTIPGEKGGSSAINHQQLLDILNRSDTPAVDVPGGSAANTIIGMACLGSRCALSGMVGRDDMAQCYRERLKEKNIVPLFAESNDSTAQVVCLITPDGQRTMRSFLGASEGYYALQLKEEYFTGVKLVHIEGYAIYNDNGELVKQAAKMAKKAGSLVSLDLSSFEIVRKYKPLIMELLQQKLIDVIFCNDDEAKELSSSVEDTCELLASYCRVAIVTMGAKGCWAKQHNYPKRFFPTTPIPCIDATGAGDIFAAGFLHMFLKGYSLDDCCRVAHTLGGAVLSVVGAQLPNSSWKKVFAKLKPILEKESPVHSSMLTDTPTIISEMRLVESTT